MPTTHTFTLVANKVVVVTDINGNTEALTHRPDFNVFQHPQRNSVVITDEASYAGMGLNSYEYKCDQIVGNPTPEDKTATVQWLTANYFKGDSIADVSVDTINVDIVRNNLETLKNEANDLVKTATYYAVVEAGNPSGSTDNIKTLVYSSVELGLTVTETFTWDLTDKFLTSTLS